MIFTCRSKFRKWKMRWSSVSLFHSAM